MSIHTYIHTYINAKIRRMSPISFNINAKIRRIIHTYSIGQTCDNKGLPYPNVLIL